MPDVISHYRIIRKLGAGGMGEIFLAEDTRLERTVALKVLPSDFASDTERKRRLIQEAKAASALSHPNVCVIYEIGETGDGRPFIAMEYIEGETLDARMALGTIPAGQAVDIAIQIAEALCAAHAKGITHRDIKPQNVMITNAGRVKVLDFGLAKRTAPAGAGNAPTAQHTEAGAIMGTLAYMSPEQTKGLEADHRTDIFSFGALLSEMVKDPSARVREIIGKCLERDRERRYQNAHSLLRNLRKAQRPGNRRALAAAAMILVPLLLMAAAKFWPSRDSAVTADISSVVVLPARVFGAAELSYLADAVPNTLSSHLANVQGLETKVPPTSIEIAQVGNDYAKIADVYGVNALVLTAITADSGAFQLNLQVIDPRTRRVMWSNPYQGPRTKYLELIRAAGEGLRAALRPSSSPVRTLAGQSSSSEAELAFREGEHYRDRYNYRHEAVDFDLALAALKRALDLDPALANAAAEISRLYGMRIDAGASAAEVLPESESWANRALQIDPNCGRAYSALSYIEDWKQHGSQVKRLSHALRAVKLSPEYSNAHAHLRLALQSSVLGIEAVREARRVDPLYLYAAMAEAGYLQNIGKPAEALEILEKHVLSVEPDIGFGLWAKAAILLDLHKVAEARPVIAEVEKQVSSGRLPELSRTTIRHQLALRESNAEAAKKELEKLFLTPHSHFGLEVVNTSIPVLAEQGHMDDAFELLRRTIRGGVIPPYDWLMLDPRLERMRADTRFHEVRDSARERFTEMLKVLDEAKQQGQLPNYLEQPLANLKRQLGV